MTAIQLITHVAVQALEDNLTFTKELAENEDPSQIPRILEESAKRHEKSLEKLCAEWTKRRCPVDS